MGEHLKNVYTCSTNTNTDTVDSLSHYDKLVAIPGTLQCLNKKFCLNSFAQSQAHSRHVHWSTVQVAVTVPIAEDVYVTGQADVQASWDNRTLLSEGD